MQDMILDSIIDLIKIIPFLFISFILMELIEHKLNNKKILERANKFGPVIGTILGIIPQCGFSALATNLYAARVITLGTLISIYLSTSDEMLPIMLSEKAELNIIMKILTIKVITGLLAGLIINIINKNKEKVNIKSICEDEECHCQESIIKSSITHTLKISVFILIINVILNFILKESILSSILINNKYLSTIISSFVGLIPNCASSILITKLYLKNIITFGTCISGLLSSSGIGILILFKQNKNLKENIKIVFILVTISIIIGIIFDFIN